MTRGFADVHNQQFANLGFGGKAFWGSPMGPLPGAVPHCKPAHGSAGLNDIMGNLMRTVAYKAPGVGAGHLVGGYPEFDGWPRWDSVTHQSVHEEWLRVAVDGGMR